MEEEMENDEENLSPLSKYANRNTNEMYRSLIR
jgi:hypothetical protein